MKEIQHVQVLEMLMLRSGEQVAVKNMGMVAKSATVYNFDVAGNENYFVTDEGVLVHNGYASADGTKLEDDIEQALKDAEIPYQRGQQIGPNGSVGEIDLQTDNWIIEATVSPKGKLRQIRDYFTEPLTPAGKSVVLVSPNYRNTE